MEGFRSRDRFYFGDRTVVELLPQPKKFKPVYLGEFLVTTYNPEAGQTDSTPCIAGGNGIDICEQARNGERPIAFSQELLEWAGGSPLEVWDTVVLESTNYPDDPRCNGEFKVMDAMNARFRQRADIFMMNRSDNISCRAKITVKKQI